MPAEPLSAPITPAPMPFQGLTSDEASRRLAAEGFNELPSARPHSMAAIALGVVREPMILLLGAAVALYLILGDLAEGALLIFSILFIVSINLYQERRTERALEALRDLSSPRALVIRDGQHLRIAGREVVRGDLIVLAEGDRVSADCILRQGTNVSVDESLLTGESVPVDKLPDVGESALRPPGGDRHPYLYSGTLIVRGQGLAEVMATGAGTALGRIGKALEQMQVQQTRVQAETRRIVRLLATSALAMSVFVTGVYGATHDWQSGLLVGITLAMALIPEEFPVVLTVFLALGAWRLSRQQVLTRRVPAVETLGAATVLCVDKTGTLTLNQMTVRRLFAGNQTCEISAQPASAPPTSFEELVEFSALASLPSPADPMERAIRSLAERTFDRGERLHEDWSLAHQYPLTPELLAISHAWRSLPGGEIVVAAKGAPEAIGELCHFDSPQTDELMRQVEAMAVDGLRVLGVARASFDATEPPADQHNFDFAFVGLVGLVDPVRPGVPEAIKECYRAGIRVVMITGDYPVTARHIGQEAGLRAVQEVLTGSELAVLTDAELPAVVSRVNIFARMVPEQKLRLVNALKAAGEVVAMTGDGVNDAPALRASDIGVAMGARGTDVAREAADLVLLDDDFSSIVRAVRLGRGIYDNLRKAMAYLLAVHVPIAGLSLLPILLGTPLVLLPAHVVFLELIIDPACSIAFEAEAAGEDVMKRPPRSVREPLFSRAMVGISLVQGFSVLAVVLVIYFASWADGHHESEARAMTFTTIVLTNLALILANRSWSRSLVDTLRTWNAPFLAVTVGAILLLAMALYVPYLQDVFEFATLPPAKLALCFVAAMFVILWFECLKLVRRRINA